MSAATPHEARLERALTDLADVLQVLTLRSAYLQRTLDASREDLTELDAAVRRGVATFERLKPGR
jgi:hypothetical protein